MHASNADWTKFGSAAGAGLSAVSADTCSSRWEVAKRLGDLDLHGVTTAPRHHVTQDDLLPALQGERAAAALWQHLGDQVGERETLEFPICCLAVCALPGCCRTAMAASTATPLAPCDPPPLLASRRDGRRHQHAVHPADRQLRCSGGRGAAERRGPGLVRANPEFRAISFVRGTKLPPSCTMQSAHLHRCLAVDDRTPIQHLQQRRVTAQVCACAGRVVAPHAV
jgi:hypothetical protein